MTSASGSKGATPVAPELPEAARTGFAAEQAAAAQEAELAAMGERDVQRLIFHPGFSTAAAVTAVSGRGVGMDVVKTNIERIGGTVEVHSREGKGSTFVVKIPLTLAIVSALVVQAWSERFAIPQIGVLELVRVGGSGARIERIASRGPLGPESLGWYEQDWPEFVLLVSGAALLDFGGGQERRLAPGDWVLLPAGCRHRVAWVAPDEDTLWLAVHGGPEGPAPTLPTGKADGTGP